MSFFKKIFVLAVCLLAGAVVVFGALFLSGVVVATAVGMGLFILFCLIGAAALIVCAVIYDRLLLKKYKSTQLNLPEKFTCTAHTGCCGTKENSLESIVTGTRCGANVVEFDLNFNAEGEAVLSHDTPKGGEVTLDEAFRLVADIPLIRVNVDVKNTADLEQVKMFAERHGLLGRIFYTGIFEKDVAAVRAQTPEIPYYLNVNVPERYGKNYLNSLVRKVKDAGAIGINLNKKGASKKLVDTLHKNDLLVSFWTADSEKDICRLLTYSPDNITTKRPDRFYAILKERML